ncbi:unnamed protein product [Zymoseptoria tritici ST99CH_1A5]|uniref:Uncharacterized protein n=4 Tax=Zymoseptoria tritici TaxID=1047171 RepID=F9XN63_ZYMTI|nr:uncharacterized protein MYCGRDRAFT_106138 [Zymoseptoria tritici IPO323]SMQ55286.1 unnamed protein product [Zymoseptoria tritici ST99CH_3D7]SMR60496.1 unnamed protein product [Zymoseptoria tritici ST99CH_1E4]SMR63608.1 unnamed protein product [Zymoseptoria tritici ST99CH_3D1]SMY28972.1 unnamed protein product [Zymoseptoria tritici ST99CH_1A5]EGP83357.1 hypothetical protein MYCGRDRAFT_106138 [Zymoseptoria tritici IPO323]
MSRQKTVAHYTRILSQWPADVLRPERTFADGVLKPRLSKPPATFRSEDKEINAAYLLIGDAFRKQYPLPASLMKPASQPEFYDNLARELKELPSRSMFGAWVKRMKNMIRWK